MQVTLAQAGGEPVPPITIGARQVKSKDLEVSGPVESESGMSVGGLLSLVGIAPKQLGSITVTKAPDVEGATLLGPEAIGNVTAFGGVYRAVFRAESQTLVFLAPPSFAGESIRSREIPATVGQPLYVTVQIDGGLLGVTPPTFSPAAPQVGSPVSFALPTVTHPPGQVTNRTYSWSFEDGGVSEVRQPTHTFESAGPHTVTVSVTAELHVRGVEVHVSGEASVSVPVGTAAAQSPSSGAGHEGGAGGAPAGAGVSPPRGGSAGAGNVPGGSVAPGHGGNTGAHAVGARTTGAAHSPDKLSLSFAGGPGGAGHGAGAPRNDRAPAGAGANGRHAPAKRQQGARPTGAPPLVGILLEANAGKLPGAFLASDALASQDAAAVLPSGAPGSDGDGGPVGVLGWIAGILTVVIVVCIGGLAELWPGVSYRRLVAR
jgi:hypothetical protein